MPLGDRMDMNIISNLLAADVGHKFRCEIKGKDKICVGATLNVPPVICISTAINSLEG
jgi:hypothetical protein